MKCVAITFFNLVLLAVHAQLFAASNTFDVDLEFVEPITLTETNALQFGLVSTDAENTNILSINSAGDVGGLSSLFIGGVQAAAAITVTASNLNTLEIIINNIVNGQGYTLGTFVCDYNGGGESGCSSAMNVSSVASGVLLIGATLTADGTDVAGTANGSFDIVITYQ